MIARLIAAATSAGSRVYDTRVDPLPQSVLPAICVYTLREEIDQDETEGTAPRELVRVARMEVAGFVGGADAAVLAAAVDDLAEQIEAAVNADPYLGGTASDSILDDTEIEIRAEEGRSDPLVGIVTLTFLVTYHSTVAVAADSLDDFMTVGQDTKVVGGIPGDTKPASDLFTVQETP